MNLCLNDTVGSKRYLMDLRAFHQLEGLNLFVGLMTSRGSRGFSLFDIWLNYILIPSLL